MDPTFTDAVVWVRDVGTIGILVVIVIAWLRGWVVSKREFEAMAADRQWWRDTAMRALTLGEAAVRRPESRSPDEPGSG